MMRNGVKIASRAAGVSFAGGVAYGAYLYQTDEGTKRMIKAYATFVPVVLHYRWVEAKHKISPQSDQDWLEMDKMYAKSTVEKLAELQGMYTKYGQTAAGMTNTFSDIWIQELRKLENEVPPRPVETVYRTIQEETGKPVNETFEFFDPVPMGSASIGQVHRARVVGGKEVAVKVQYPESRRLFRKDMSTIRSFCEALAPENVVLLSALENQNALEMDYRTEAKNLLQVRANMERDGFSPRQVVVPEPLLELTTERLLVMELIPGPKLMDGIRDYFATWAKKNNTTLESLESEARRRVQEEGIPDKYDGPSALQLESYKRYLFLHDLFINAGKAIYNHSVGQVRPRMTYTRSEIPLNIPRYIDTLMKVHGCQLLKDGFFNADPHGGNFLLMPDGRLGMIDYGASKSFTREERLSSCLLFAALARNDEKVLFDLCEIGGYKSKHGRKDVLLKLLKFGYDSWGRDVMGNKNIQQFVDELKAEDPWEEVPDNFVMAQFMSIRLRSLALGMNHPVRCSDWWGPMAEQVLIDEGMPYDDWDYALMEKYKPVTNMQKYKFG